MNVERPAERSNIGTATAAVVSEARWPMALAVLVAIGLTALLPAEVRVLPSWLVPSLEGALLVALVVTDPGRIDRRARGVRLLSIALVALLMASALLGTVQLIHALIVGGAITNSPGELLLAANVVWLSTIIAFSLLYWEIDGGGPAQRAHGLRRYPDFAFPQQLSPDVAPPNWRPRYVDYMYLGFTNATAFSPTDAMPLAAWAKLTMTLQSGLSLAVLGLVIARAVNVLK